MKMTKDLKCEDFYAGMGKEFYDHDNVSKWDCKTHDKWLRECDIILPRKKLSTEVT